MIKMKIETDNNLECIGIEFIKDKVVAHCKDLNREGTHKKSYYLSEYELIHTDFVDNIKQIMLQGHTYAY